MGVTLGAELVPVPDTSRPAFDPGVQLLVEIRNYLAGLPEAVRQAVANQQPPEMPRPIVQVAEPDLSAIVTAVNGLKPGATAAEIGREIARQINPQPVTENSAMVEAMRELTEKIDFRMQGVGRAFGSSGPSNIADNPNRQLGIVTVSGLTTVGTTTVAAPLTNQATWTSGAAVQMTAASDPVTNGILVRGLKGNTNPVYVGASGVTTSTGFELSPGESTSFTCANANLIYFIGTHSGDGVCFSVL